MFHFYNFQILSLFKWKSCKGQTSVYLSKFINIVQLETKGREPNNIKSAADKPTEPTNATEPEDTNEQIKPSVEGEHASHSEHIELMNQVLLPFLKFLLYPNISLAINYNLYHLYGTLNIQVSRKILIGIVCITFTW